ncbi:SDR family NAD(P)-dependent oxidoreductase [Citromicrobium bathyomarinum]|uniref:SDR family oxidoreductase n=1 Tax=Alphaproteobacteria TaxID=28211 RepID=UPI000C113697|nr:SDR family NAD(P)-dependent oxidoreductase [Henriciella sp.]MBL4791959.1 SDR family oxidoreductase [Citromicrobium sp.]MBO80697.1 short-chain dehydrogenase [Citromicrobium sp.]PHR71145.1 MAG: short-chain dehydrogenase [Henriciella sp.]|tara:strand:- start:113 stop:781 length:669 start_codon:yes stop_codon:yes gene_type:complete
MSKKILIIGASRGIGLGLAKEFASRGWNVVASERTRSEELHDAGEIDIVTVDVTEPDSYLGLKNKFGEGSLDAIIVNAGITGAAHQSAEDATDEEIAHVMQTNAYGPARVGKALLPMLKDGGTLAFMSSLMGSITDSSGGYEFYRVSKVSLNMLAKGIAESQAKERDVEVLSLHPGWVQTDMGGPNAKITVEESCKGLADVVEKAGGAGYRFVNYKGEQIPF